MTTLTTESTLTKQQYKSFGPRAISSWGTGAAIWAHVRYDDECGNGHNTFAITGSIRVPRQKDAAACGCLHDEIAKAFPDLAPLIKWHLCSSDGPMHYISNTVFNASERDYNGKLAGESTSFTHAVQFGSVPIKHKISKSFSAFLQKYRRGIGGDFDFEVIRYDHENRHGDSYEFAPKYTFGGYAAKWHECPFDTELEALEFLKALQTCNPVFLQVPTAWSKGKMRELDAARNSAIWPEATDEELTAPGLEDRLTARLPQLLADFKAAVESLGFVW